jgi:DNA-binding PadR family transcriptional regulator
MTVRESIGEFEHLVLLAIARIGSDAGGAGIHAELQSSASRDAAIPAIYVTLGRLQQKGLVRSRIVPAGDRGGRARRLYTLTSAGLSELRQTRAMLERMWSGVASLEPRTR